VKKIYWLLPAAALGIFVSKRAGLLEPVNYCETSPNATEASLRTRVYAASPEKVRAVVLAAIAKQNSYGRSWHVVAEREDTSFAVRVEVPVLVFTDDLTITVSPHERGSRLDVHSQARVGRGDFGENRRHVLQILFALDAALPIDAHAILTERRQTPRVNEQTSLEGPE
jgi:uncharacterized protein (DUF1499 family)